jgi:hypothetical protein
LQSGSVVANVFEEITRKVVEQTVRRNESCQLPKPKDYHNGRMCCGENNIRFIFNKSVKQKKMTTEELTIEESTRRNQTFLNSDGGDITSLISIEEDKHVKVRLEGAY